MTGRTILGILLLLPFAVTAQAAKSKSKHRSASEVTADGGARVVKHRTASKKTAVSAAKRRSAPEAIAEETTPVASRRSKRTARASRTSSEAAQKLATRATEAIPESKKPEAADSEAPVSKPDPKISTASADASAPSMYDRNEASKSSFSLLNWFGPRSGGIRYDARMIRAAQIAENRARQHSVRSCWRYVKTALLEADVLKSYPKTAYAKQAGEELLREHGFRRLPISDPFKAPLGAVIVYGGSGAGHVEIRTKEGFVSDFESPTPSRRPLLGVFVKPS